MSDQNIQNNAEVFNEPESTIFSDPAHFKDENSQKSEKKHKLLFRVLATLLIVAVLAGGTFAAFKLIPEKSEDNDDAAATIPVTSIAENSVNYIEIINDIGTVKLNAELGEKDNESIVTWTVDGVDSSLTSSDSISSFAGNILSLSALQKINSDSADFGFSDPEAKITVYKKEDTLELTLGNSAPANIGYYCKVSTDTENVYIISDEFAYYFMSAEEVSFANAPGFTSVKNDKNNSCFSDNSIIDMDYIKISGKKHSTPFEIVMQEDDAINAYFAFRMQSPTVRVCDSTAPQAVLDAFSNGFSAAGAYAYGTDAETLKKYGLDNPDYQVTLCLNGEEFTVRFAVVDDSYVAFVDGKTDMVQKVALSSISFATADIESYYSTFVILENLSGLKQFIVESDKGKYVFDTEYTETPDGEDDQYKAFFGGNELKIKRFKDYYGTLIAMTPISYETKSLTNVYAKITFKHSSDLSDTVLTFKKVAKLRYQAEIDGIPVCQVTSTALDKFLSDTVKMSKNEY